MPKRRAPKPVRLGGKTPDDSLLFRALCGIADNLGNILRVGLMVGFVAILDPLLGKIQEFAGTAVEPALNAIDATGHGMYTGQGLEDTPSDGALRAIRDSDERLQFVSNCTRLEFQKTHYDACFPDGSDVYPRPTADEDDGSLLFLLESETLYATR